MSEQLSKPNLYKEALVTEIAGREIAIIEQNGREQHLEVHHDSEKPRMTLLGQGEFDSIAASELATQNSAGPSYREKLLAGGEFGMSKGSVDNAKTIDVIKAPEATPKVDPRKLTYREKLLAGGEVAVNKFKERGYRHFRGGFS
jgi:hypothetical protein